MKKLKKMITLALAMSFAVAPFQTPTDIQQDITMAPVLAKADADNEVLRQTGVPNLVMNKGESVKFRFTNDKYKEAEFHVYSAKKSDLDISYHAVGAKGALRVEGDWSTDINNHMYSKGIYCDFDEQATDYQVDIKANEKACITIRLLAVSEKDNGSMTKLNSLNLYLKKGQTIKFAKKGCDIVKSCKSSSKNVTVGNGRISAKKKGTSVLTFVSKYNDPAIEYSNKYKLKIKVI